MWENYSKKKIEEFKIYLTFKKLRPYLQKIFMKEEKEILQSIIKIGKELQKNYYQKSSNFYDLILLENKIIDIQYHHPDIYYNTFIKYLTECGNIFKSNNRL